MSLILRLLVAVASLCIAGVAQADCTLASAVTANVGTQTSYAVRAGGIAAVSVPTMLACNGSVLSLVSTDYAKATPVSASGFKLRSAAGDTISYRLSADQAGTRSFSQYPTIDYLDPTLLSLLGILNGNSFVPTMYAALADTPNVPAGVYSDTVTVNWSWAICRGVGVGGLCVLQERNSGSTTLTVTVAVTKDCRISAPPVSFGTAPLIRQFASVTQAVLVDCTKGASFSIAFTGGSAGAARPWRQMKGPGGSILRYNIYRPDGTTIWDESNPQTSAAPGTGETAPSLPQTYVAKVDASQATPAPGRYTDTVSVVISF